MQFIEQLSEQVALTILSRNNANLLECMSFVPPSLHPLALRAQHPSLAQSSSISLDALPFMLVSFWFGHRSPLRHFVFTALATLGAEAAYTSLSIPGCWLSGEISGAQFGQGQLVGDSLSTVQQSLLSVLTSCVGLQSLEFQHGLTSECSAALIEAITVRDSLTALQRLVLAGKPTKDVSGVMRSLVKLPVLRSLSIIGVSRDWAGLTGFCAALKQMTALTCLELSHCFVLKAPPQGSGFHLSPVMGMFGACFQELLPKGGLNSREEDTGIETQTAVEKEKEEQEVECDGFQVTKIVGETIGSLPLLVNVSLFKCFNFDYIEPVLDAVTGRTQLTQLCIAGMHSMESMRSCGETGDTLVNDDILEHAGFGKKLVPMLRSSEALQSLDMSWYGVKKDVATGVRSMTVVHV